MENFTEHVMGFIGVSSQLMDVKLYVELILVAKVMTSMNSKLIGICARFLQHRLVPMV